MTRELDSARAMIEAGADFIVSQFKKNLGGRQSWSAEIS
jgi:predicted TIM-barrel enzyme